MRKQRDIQQQSGIVNETEKMIGDRAMDEQRAGRRQQKKLLGERKSMNNDRE